MANNRQRHDLKQPGNHKTHRLHVIHLYEHDYSLLLAVKWRSLIHHCVHTKSLTQDNMEVSRDTMQSHPQLSKNFNMK